MDGVGNVIAVQGCTKVNVVFDNRLYIGQGGGGGRECERRPTPNRNLVGATAL